MNISLNGSSSFISTLAMGLCTRPWKSTPMPTLGPTASRTAATFSRHFSTLSNESMYCSSSVPFIFTAVKPRSTAPLAAAAVSAGRSPPIHEYTRMRSRTLPPSSCDTGTPRSLPLMSQSAWSMPASALMWMAPPR